MSPPAINPAIPPTPPEAFLAGYEPFFFSSPVLPLSICACTSTAELVNFEVFYKRLKLSSSRYWMDPLREFRRGRDWLDLLSIDCRLSREPNDCRLLTSRLCCLLFSRSSRSCCRSIILLISVRFFFSSSLASRPSLLSRFY